MLRTAPAVALALLAAAPSPPAAAAPPVRATDAPGPDFLARLASFEDFIAISLPGTTANVERAAKFILPATADPALLGAMFQNAHLYRFHHELLAAVFPDRFPGLTLAEYLALVERRASRRYYAGTVTAYRDVGRGLVYGFTAFVDGTSAGEMLEPAEVLGVYQKLKAIFLTELPSVPLEYAPTRSAEIARAASWVKPGFPVYLAPSVAPPDYVAYTAATSYGRVHRFTLEELEAAGEAGELTFQDLVVVDGSPADIAAAVGGVITALPQGELSHLSVRLSRRGVPNAYLKGAPQTFATWAGKLVRLDVEAERYLVREATVAEAEGWWRDHRPRLKPIPAPDASHSGLDLVNDIDLTPGVAVARFGGKAAGLARLYSFLPAAHRTQGFGIPVKHYLEFLAANRRPSLADPQVQVTYADYIAELLADGRFRSDPAYRRELLDELRQRAEDEGAVPPALVDALKARIAEVFGGAGVKVRFRSSSNAEDSLEFSGAGLYDSTSVCLLDDLDGDEAGPSRCDPEAAKERTIARGLKRVWMSLWKPAAFEEREYFQIDHGRAAMGVLVTRAYPAEDSNGVAFTGNPSNRFDRGHVVNVQVGDADVVSPEPGVDSEKDVLYLDGARLGVAVRARASSLVVPGQHVLSDEQLRELGAVLALVDAEFLRGVDLEGHSREEVLVDVEFKYQDGQLILKQARPFLLVDLTPPGPVFELEVAAGTVACGLWEEYREARDEHRLKARLTLRAGVLQLPVRAGTVLAPLVERFELGADRLELEPLDSGSFRVGPPPFIPGGGERYYWWQFEQRFAAADRAIRLTIDSLFLATRDGLPVEPRFVVDEERLLEERFLTGQLLDAGGEPEDFLRFGSCTYHTLPLWEIRVDLGGGDRLLFHERYQVPFAGSGPANVLRGEAWIDGQHFVETSYWNLVYAADHHNWNEEFAIVLDEPRTLRGVEGVRVIHVQEGFDQIPRLASLRDESFEVLLELGRRPPYEKVEVPPVLPGIFRRGETTGDGRVDIADAVRTLGWLFSGGTAPWCADAADSDDSGTIELTDAILLLQYLFLGGGEPPAPGTRRCGLDEEADELPDCASPAPGC